MARNGHREQCVTIRINPMPANHSTEEMIA